jgi:hypothetical protein
VPTTTVSPSCNPPLENRRFHRDEGGALAAVVVVVEEEAAEVVLAALLSVASVASEAPVASVAPVPPPGGRGMVRPSRPMGKKNMLARRASTDISWSQRGTGGLSRRRVSPKE